MMTLRWYGSYGAVCCVIHADRRPSLLLRDGDTVPLFAVVGEAAELEAERQQ